MFTLLFATWMVSAQTRAPSIRTEEDEYRAGWVAADADIKHGVF